MKRLLAIGLLTLVSVTGPAQAEEQRVVRLASDFTYPPFNYRDPEGKPVGFDIEIADALCQEMQVKCEWVMQDWSGLIPALLANKADAIMASMRITEDRKKKVLFTHKYYQTPARFVAREKDHVEISKAGLKGKAIGVQRGTIHDTYVTDMFGDVADIKRYSGQEEVYLDASSGRLDVVFGNSDQLALAFLDQDAGKDFVFVGEAVKDPKYIGEGTALALRKRDEKLANEFNQAIATIRANGKYDEIANRYFNFDIYGD
ncbi:nickel transporter [Hahella sp. CCB-MM4]|uniref:ABC transporter substrate-binding protein n=1 Tax=Hahella sp. (strain CCB-MM4) TaxID=1926491 RepID=UPI000B9AD190|nr:ABC transporter substrate-binding protein [Hahella sp. CCB-MM4]OZG69992.1 nickel transporter [Hahella sp. CCB-MM4]